MLSAGARRMVRAWTVLVLVFLYAPLLLVVLNAFNTSRTFAFPPTGFTWAWWVDAWNSEGMWKSLVNSVVVGLVPRRSLWCWARWQRSPSSGTSSSAGTP